ncbi:hypothetical protein [Syntrophotalea acetylenica]|uniref:hypothetical protein n=1 Tax=Syntrophotalea acetylenica TaxID=29542 RepID=UPI001313EAD8|nr:hypothetical protein [Syntrophotalea acetylenica]
MDNAFYRFGRRPEQEYFFDMGMVAYAGGKDLRIVQHFIQRKSSDRAFFPTLLELVPQPEKINRSFIGLVHLGITANTGMTAKNMREQRRPASHVAQNEYIVLSAP